MPTEQRGVSMVFQSYAVWPHMTVFDNVAYGLRVRKQSTADIKSTVSISTQYWCRSPCPTPNLLSSPPLTLSSSSLSPVLASHWCSSHHSPASAPSYSQCGSSFHKLQQQLSITSSMHAPARKSLRPLHQFPCTILPLRRLPAPPSAFLVLASPFTRQVSLVSSLAYHTSHSQLHL